MRFPLLSLLTLTLAGGDLVSAASIPRAATSGSPVLKGYYADPNIAIFDQTYYIYATTDGFPGWGGQVFYAWKSTDLVDWTRAEQPFLTLNGTSGNVPWAVGNAWAPTITVRDGRYYFYFSGQNAQYNRKTIGVATASSPEGPFTAQPEAMILNNEAINSSQAIDPCAFEDPETGIFWLLWGNGKPLMAQLNDDMIGIDEDTLVAMEGLTDYREGSFLVYREGIYHLTYSIDDTRSENYRVGYATADSVSGPWTYRGVVLQKDVEQGILGTGHNSLVNVPGSDDWFVAYHRFAIPGGNGTDRETCLDRATFDATTGLLQEIKPTLTGVEARPIVA
ncbi:hypothetical protein B9Z65_1166 [Elsinoe australis]|uniref:Glycosyl hydrolases family 43 protein n=1 Tax=Elsinoe australis TaxID=40998 RepID=A0A2P8AIF9_9PEZI|nr:hypothetical protein B9Z65_1166 [Elsinoe australis]